MGTPIQYKNGPRGPKRSWQATHRSKPRKFTTEISTNGPCITTTPADPEKLAAYKASLQQ